jgi:hypothetical protein
LVPYDAEMIVASQALQLVHRTPIIANYISSEAYNLANCELEHRPLHAIEIGVSQALNFSAATSSTFKIGQATQRINLPYTSHHMRNYQDTDWSKLHALIFNDFTSQRC